MYNRHTDNGNEELKSPLVDKMNPKFTMLGKSYGIHMSDGVASATAFRSIR